MILILSTAVDTLTCSYDNNAKAPIAETSDAKKVNSRAAYRMDGNPPKPLENRPHSRKATASLGDSVIGRMIRHPLARDEHDDVSSSVPLRLNIRSASPAPMRQPVLVKHSPPPSGKHKDKRLHRTAHTEDLEKAAVPSAPRQSGKYYVHCAETLPRSCFDLRHGGRGYCDSQGRHRLRMQPPNPTRLTNDHFPKVCKECVCIEPNTDAGRAVLQLLNMELLTTKGLVYVRHPRWG